MNTKEESILLSCCGKLFQIWGPLKNSECWLQVNRWKICRMGRTFVPVWFGYIITSKTDTCGIERTFVPVWFGYIITVACLILFSLESCWIRRIFVQFWTSYMITIGRSVSVILLLRRGFSIYFFQLLYYFFWALIVIWILHVEKNSQLAWLVAVRFDFNPVECLFDCV